MVGSRTAYNSNMPTKDESGDRNVENLEAPSNRRKYSDLKSTTKFQNRVYDACRCIPPGKVGTYGVLASALRSSPRAVGQALKRNPFAPKVPCHRVITSSMELGGFGGSWGIETDKVKRKRQMLGAEGVVFDDQGRLVSKASLMTLTELIQAMSQVQKSSKQSPMKE
jgi:methylated-DNA-[protein]-cysteine S-methyltransferase